MVPGALSLRVKHGNESSDSVKVREFLYQFGDFQHLKKDTDEFNQFHS
jgi:hypothetical protein